MPRYVTAAGLKMRVGGPLYRWYRLHRRALNGQPPLVNPPAHTNLERATRVVMWAHWGVENRGHFRYTESSLRSQMFHRPAGYGGAIYADCSQFVSAILHWVGVKVVTDTDFTGTLLKKGSPVKTAAPARVVIWGPGGGSHAAFITEKASGGDWWTIGFGHSPGAPDRVRLSVMSTYFRDRGEPGVRFLDFIA